MKKIFKRVISTILLFNIVYITYASAIIEYPPFTFDEQTGTITYCESVSSRLNIPSNINGHYVTSIGNQAFRQCYEITEVIFPNTINNIEGWSFAYCDGLEKITLPKSLINFKPSFVGCYNLTDINVDSENKYFCSIDGVLFSKDKKTLIEFPYGKATDYIIPDGTNIIDECAFETRSKLKSISIPLSVKNIKDCAFLKCFNITDVYYQGTEAQWNQISIGEFNQWSPNVKIHYNSYNSDSDDISYVYDQTDAGESLTIPTVNDVTTETEAVNKVQTAVNKATNEQKQSATGIDKLTLLAEEAAAKANTVKLTNSNVSVTSANIKENTALQSTTDVLTSANVNLERTARNIINYDLGNTETVNVKTEDVSNKVDAVRISTSYASATVNANTSSDFTMTNKGEKTVEINFNKDTDTTVTISFPNMNENDKYYAVVDENGNPIGGKYNPATGTLEAKLSESGIYKVVNNEKDFSDIKDKSAEMQEAIKVLASKGIINGTTATTFAPDSTISRAEVTALLMRTISLLDPNANGNFADVNTSNWYCGAAGSAKEHNIINGYEDNTFRGNTVIAKDQIVAVSARTLKQQMNYKTPSDVASELSVYADANNIANWAKEDVALATMTNLVLKRTDSTFSGSDGMTRGDAAIIMQRLFNKLW